MALFLHAAALGCPPVAVNACCARRVSDCFKNLALEYRTAKDRTAGKHVSYVSSVEEKCLKNIQ